MANPMDWETGWGFMQKGIAQVKKIIEGETNDPIPNDFYMNLYSTSYLMSSQNPPHYYAKELYEEYVHTLDNYATAKVFPSILAKHDEFMLSEIVKRWSNHKVMVRWLGRFFHYLERFYIPYRKLPTLRMVGLTCFRDLVYEKIKGKAKDEILALISREREGEQIDRSLLKNAREFFIEMGHDKMDFYEKDLEGAIIDDAATYYRRLSSGWILEDSCPDYMRRVELCLDAERGRVSSYMHFSTEPKLLEKLIHELLYVHTSQILYKKHSGCRELLRKDMVGDLSRMFRLYSKVEQGLESVSKIFNEHVITEGKALVEQAEEEASRQRGRGDVSQGFVRKVMELHDKYLLYVNDCFQNHTLFHKALKEAFEVLCNKSVAGNSCAEILAAFSDGILQKGGSEKLNDGAIEEMLEKIVNLLAYLADKDLFFEFCRNKLARRLLYDRSANADNERSFLTKLKQECGVQLTSKMEGMLTDLTLTRDNQASFDEYIRDNPHANPGTGLVVTVLTTVFWPNYKSSDLLLPAEMVKCVEAFREFYQSKTKQRRLMWIYSLGSCTITAKFESKTMELIVTTYQAVMLLLFNTSDRLTCADITSQLNLMDDDVVRVLHSLSCAKYKILKKVPDTKSICPSDYFEVNSQFTDKMRRIRVPLPPTEERKNLIEHVNKDRKYAIDACLVRIMKSRKVLAYQQLVRECVELLSRTFKPDIRMIKNRIEDLISREYLKRDDVNPNTFKYVA